MNEEKDTSLSELDKDVVSSDDVLAVVSGNQDAINEQMEKAKELAQAGIDADLAGLSIDQQKKIMDERRKKAEELAAEERRKAEELARQEALKNSPAEKKRLAKEAKQKAKEEAKKAKEEAKKAKEEARKQKELARKNKGKVEDVKNEKVAEVKPSVATTSVTPMPSTTNVTPAVVTPNVTATASNSVTSTPSKTNVTPAVVTPNVTTTVSNSVTPTPSKTNVTSAVVTPNVTTTASNSVTPTPSTTTNVTPAIVTPNVTTIASKSETSPSATTFTTTNTSTEKVSDTGKEVSDSDKKSGKKTSNLKMYLTFIFLALLILMIVFLPEINTFVHDFFNKKEAENTPSITSGHLICTLETNDSNFNYEYETDFSFKDSKLYKLTLTTKTVGDLNLDATDLSGLNASCQLLQFQTSKFEGVEVMCDLEGNTFTNTQTLDYEILNRDEVTTAYLEAGGIYPDYKYEENIDDIEKDMNAQNYSCARYED